MTAHPYGQRQSTSKCLQECPHRERRRSSELFKPDHHLSQEVSTNYCTELKCNALYCTVLHCTVHCCTVLYCTSLYSTELYCTLLHYYFVMTPLSFTVRHPLLPLICYFYSVFLSPTPTLIRPFFPVSPILFNFNYLYHVFFTTNAEFMLSECDHGNDKIWEICCTPYPRTYSH